jgi:hypothetical protein
MKESITEMKDGVERVASKMESIGHPRANEIHRIAQYLGGVPTPTNMGGFNPSFQQMAGGTEDEMSMEPKESLNPGISSFVKMRPGEEPQVDDRKTHTCTVVFKAPDGISEADMMNYILGIGKELGVDVGSFKWSKSDATSNKSSV